MTFNWTNEKVADFFYTLSTTANREKCLKLVEDYVYNQKEQEAILSLLKSSKELEGGMLLIDKVDLVQFIKNLKNDTIYKKPI